MTVRCVLLVLFLMVIDHSLVSWALDCSLVQCAQGFNPLNCPSGTLYNANAAMGGCCPGCIKFKNDGDSCEGESNIEYPLNYYYNLKTYLSTGVVPMVQSQLCAPNLSCTGAVCKYSVNPKKCPTAEDSNNPKWKPDCDVDGTYKAVQCKSNGPEPRCFCYSEEGKRIFGFDWIANRDKMHCLCSRLVNKLMKETDTQDTTYHCSTNGNFEPLQCNRGICYCAETTTGQPTSMIVPQNLWKTLSCYNQTGMGSQYLKTCDSQSNSLALILKETKVHGSNPFTLTAPPCDPDGSYSSKQCDDTQCYCRTRANVNIGSYFTGRGTDAETNQLCYCARDKVIFEDAKLSNNYICNQGGNYNPLQTVGGSAYCVDSDGFMTSEVVPIADKCDGRLSACLSCS